MSVLLTAVKKKEKTKQKRVPSNPSLQRAAGPPASNSFTAVWYWNMNGWMTTVMYTDYSKELWCNGATITNSIDRIDPLMGRVTDFAIAIPETRECHQAHLVHTLGGGHVLYVDGYLVPEHGG